MTRLKPCPWGDRGKTGHNKYPEMFKPRIITITVHNVMSEREAYAVECPWCQARGPIMDTYEEAAKAWNKQRE